MLIKFPSEKINGTKNALFFLRALTHDSFTFILRFLYELECKLHFSNTVRGISHFQFRFVFIKMHGLFQEGNTPSQWIWNIFLFIYFPQETWVKFIFRFVHFNGQELQMSLMNLQFIMQSQELIICSHVIIIHYL